MSSLRAAIAMLAAMLSMSACTGTTYNIPATYSKYIGGGQTAQPPAAPPASTVQATSPASSSVVVPPPFDGITASATLPAPSNGAATTLSLTSASSPAAAGASSVPPLASSSSTSVHDVLSYTAATSSNTVQYPGGSTLTVTIPSTVPQGGTGYYLAINAPGTGWIYDVAQGTVGSNNTVTFTIPQGITLNAGQPYVVALYQH